MRTCLYSLKIWLTAVGAAPVLNMLVDHAFHFQESSLAWLFGAFLSFPSFLLLWLGTNVVPCMARHIFFQKLLLSMGASGLTAAPFSVFGIIQAWHVQSGVFFGFYLLPILFGIWCYKWPVAAAPLSIRKPQMSV